MTINSQTFEKVVPRLSRRNFLLAIAGAGVTTALTTYGYNALFDIGSETRPETEQLVPFLGLHQAGILTPTPASALMVAFDTTANNKNELIQTFKVLTERIKFLMAGGTPPIIDPKFPPHDSGILGTKVYPDNLTITAAVGNSIFSDRYGLSQLRPKHLSEMPSFPNDELNPELCHGDLMLQFCANHAETNLHALRDIIKNLASSLVVRWKIEGFQQPNTLKGKNRTSTRNMLGFKDGTANLDTTDSKLMERNVWVKANTDEPSWATGGTYQVVRIVRNRVEFWDRTPLQEQEQIIGRKKDTGAPLGMQHEHDIPEYDRDPKGKKIRLDAHIRLANPRDSEQSLILRRGFNYSRGVDKAGQLDMGLLFACFQQDLEKGFATVQKRLNGEPLEEYIRPIGGGYFFVLPGVTNAGNYLGQTLLEA